MPNSDFSKDYKSVVLCFDGTGDWVENDVTNVAKIFACLDRTEHLAYYDGGVGTLGDSKILGEGRQLALKLVDLGTATSLGEKVVQAYLYLVRHHRPDMPIDMIGFSRGAYTARILAGMLHNFGLLRPELEHLAPYLYQSVASIRNIKEFKIDAARLRQDFGRGDKIRIRFMGLFDTVTSVGIVDRFRVFPNTDWNPSIERTCHAVAIEESRNAFPEALMHPAQPNLTEVWFPGVHRDCGGGVDPAKSRIADEALRWIELEAIRAGLKLNAEHTPDRAVPPSPNYPTLDPYVFLGFYPQKIFTKRVSDFRIYWPNFRHVRVVPDGALVHEIVRETYPGQGGDEMPPNLPRRCRTFRTGDHARTLRNYLVPTVPANPEDFVGVTLGAVLLAQFWNQFVGSPFGDSWPGVAGWVETGLFALFLYGQAVGKGLTSSHARARVRPLLDVALPAAGGAIALAMLLFFLPPLAVVGFIVGAVAWAVGQLGSLPIVRADRILPYLLRSGFYAAVAVWIGIWALGRLPSSFQWRLHVADVRFSELLPSWIPKATLGQAAIAIVMAVALAFALKRLYRDRPIMKQKSETPRGTKEVRGRRRGEKPIFRPDLDAPPTV